jgi:hypothetical protein
MRRIAISFISLCGALIAAQFSATDVPHFKNPHIERLLVGPAHAQFIGEGIWKTVPSAGGTVVTVDTAQGPFNTQSTGSTQSFGIGSGLNHQALVVGVIQCTGGASVTAVTWNGTSMTSVSGTDNTIWGLVAPTGGTHNTQVTFSGGGTVSVYLLSVYNADQTGGTTTFHNYTNNSATATPASVTVTSASNEIVFADYINSAGGVTFTTPANGTNVGAGNSGSNCSGNANAANYATGAASVNMQYNQSSSQFYIGYGLTIKKG